MKNVSLPSSVRPEAPSSNEYEVLLADAVTIHAAAVVSAGKVLPMSAAGYLAKLIHMAIAKSFPLVPLYMSIDEDVWKTLQQIKMSECQKWLDHASTET